METILDVPFTVEEIEAVIKHLKVGKAGVDDDIQQEHIKFGGHQLTVWLIQIYKSIVELESIPSTMKTRSSPFVQRRRKRPTGDMK